MKATVVGSPSIPSIVIGVAGGIATSLFGGCTQAMVTLLICMGIDYVTGLLVAGVFKNSKKSKTGGLESRAGWKGLCRKGVTLLFVLIGHQLDMALGVGYIRDSIVIAYIVMEIISIKENAQLMGIPVPPILDKAIDLLNFKAKGPQQEEEKKNE